MMLYALGALELFDGIYDIESVRMAIYQPRQENVSVYAMAKAELLQWAEGELTERAKLVYAGEHCRFCKAKAVCRKRAEYNLELAKYDFEMPATLEDDRYMLDAFYSEDNEYGSSAAEDMADYFGIERASAYRRKNRALAKLTTLLFGKP